MRMRRKQSIPGKNWFSVSWNTRGIKKRQKNFVKWKKNRVVFSFVLLIWTIYQNTIHPSIPWRVHLQDLLDYFQQAVSRTPAPEPVHEIPQEEITVSQQMNLIMDSLNFRQGGLKFFDLFPPSAGRGWIVVTFLALLELMRLRKVLVYQQKVFSEIIIFPYSEALREGEDSAVCP